MRILKIMLSLLVFLIGGTTAEAQNEAGVKYNLTTRCIPEDASLGFPNSARYTAEDSIHLQAISNEGFIFLRWENESGIEVSGSSDYDFTMPSHDVVLTAVFEFAPEYLPEPGLPMFILSLKANPSEGVSSFSGVGNHVGGTAVEVGTSPAEHYIFDNWTDEQGKVVSEDLGFSYTMPERHSTLTANFHYDFDPSDLPEPGLPKFILSLKSNPSEGSASLSGADEYISGTEVEVSASPSELYLFDNWTDEQGEIVSEDLSFSYTMPERHTELTANFHYDFDPSDFQEPGQPKFILSLKSNPSDGSASLSGAGEHISGSEVEVSASPAERYLFDNWTDEQGKVVSEDLSFSYTMPERHTALTANFHYNFDADDIGEPEMPSIGTVSECLFNREDDTHITIECATPGAKIYYTLDGTDPTVKSSVYTDVVILPGNVTVKAFAVKYGMADSPISEYVVEGFTVDTPTCEYANLALAFSVATDDAEIRYTLDGSEPTEDATLYTSPLNLLEDCKVTARGFKVLYDPSDTVSYTFVYSEHQVEAPVLTYDPEALTVTMASPTENAEIRYTIDGEAPTESTGVKYEGPVAVTGNHTYTAKAFRSDLFASEAASVTVGDQQVPTPTASFANRVLTLSCPDVNAQIRYTLDGTDPTFESTLYSAPVALTQDCTVKIIAQREYFIDSEVATFDFKVADHQVALPGFGYDAENSMLTISCATENAEIRYTSDGTDPTATTGIKYEGPIKVEGNSTYKARAFRSDLLDSKVASLVIDDQAVATPTASFANKLLTLSCEDENATIRYTLDGTNPTSESALYNAPLALTSDCIVKFIAQRENYNDSEVAAFQFKVADYQVEKPVFVYNTEAGIVTITCGTENAEIRYALDGSVPTLTTGTKYTGAITVASNLTVNAKAFRSDLFDSETATLVINDKQVPTPTASFANKQLTLACADSRATIYYTTNGADPTTSSAVYTAPIALTSNCTVKFFATRENYNASNVGTFLFAVEDYMVATPVLTYNPIDSSLSISCATENAEIRYTTDGSEPTATNGSIYTAPVTYYGNVTFNARAFRTGLFDSEVASLVISGQKVAAPVITHSLETLKVTMTTATEGATIRYTTDGTTPTATTGTAYTAPVDLNGNMTFTARAFHSNYLDSDVTVYEVSDMKLPKPTAAYGKHAVTLACEDNTAQIRYTTDGTAPTASSALYTAPIAMSADCTVRFIATKTGFVASDEGSYRFVLADWQEAMPTMAKDFTGRKITISQANSLPVNLTIDGTLQNLQTPATLDVTPGMTAVTAVAVARDEDSYDSPAMSDEIVFHMVPAITYDGHTLRVALADGEPAAIAAERQLFIDGKLTANGTADLSTEINDFCNVTARVQSESAFISDPVDMRIDVYNTGRVAAARNGHRLAEAFGTWGDKADSYEYLRLGGELSRADIDVVAALPQLKTLHMEVDSLAAEDYAGALAGTRIETIFSNEYPEGMLTGMPRLTTLMWGRTDRAIPDGRVTEAGNPNLLFWTPSLDLLPADASNIVEYEYAPDGLPTDPDGIGVSGRAEEIHLYDGCPFQAHMPVTAGHIDFKKIFRLPTEIKICAGWETIVLPFTAKTISHERQGVIAPFAAWDGQNDPYGGIKPFWLYSSNEAGWEEAASIEAGVPYIISMPNNKEYVESSNLNGEVTFLADGEILLGTQGSAPKTTPWQNGSEFTGTFMPLEGTGILSMNVDATDGEYAGSAFTADAVTLPFGAYVWAPGQPQAIPVFPDGSGVQLPTVSTDGGVTVETPAPGMMRISSSRALHTAIFTPEGATVRVIDLQAGETLEVDGLTLGLYIVGGVKAMVR